MPIPTPQQVHAAIKVLQDLAPNQFVCIAPFGRAYADSSAEGAAGKASRNQGIYEAQKRNPIIK